MDLSPCDITTLTQSKLWVVHGSGKLIPSRFWSTNKIFSRLSTWMFPGIWCSCENGPWHIAVEPGDVAQSVPAFSLATFESRFAACRWLFMVCLDFLPIMPWRLSLICCAGLKRCLWHCCMISLSSITVTFWWQKLGKVTSFKYLEVTLYERMSLAQQKPSSKLLERWQPWSN